MTAYIAYCRVSTDRQGTSGLGLDAQEATIRRHLRDDDNLVLPVMVEVESGTRRDRPILRRAVARCRVMGATLIVAKLDRLARDSAFVSTIKKSGVRVEFCDVPASQGPTGDFILGVLAGVAQLEAGLISERTKAALAQSKKKLGGDRGHRHTAEDARAYGLLGGQRLAEAADAAALAASDLLAEVRTRLGNSPSLQAVAREMNAIGARTPRGGQWTATAVKRAVARIEQAA